MPPATANNAHTACEERAATVGLKERVGDPSGSSYPVKNGKELPLPRSPLASRAPDPRGLPAADVPFFPASLWHEKALSRLGLLGACCTPCHRCVCGVVTCPPPTPLWCVCLLAGVVRVRV
jgi:hypothetical protein